MPAEHALVFENIDAYLVTFRVTVAEKLTEQTGIIEKIGGEFSKLSAPYVGSYNMLVIKLFYCRTFWHWDNTKLLKM